MGASFTTTDYQFAHGKKPRGTGNWAFVPADYVWPDGLMPEDAIAWYYGLYSDAKRSVSREWPAVTTWTVLS